MLLGLHGMMMEDYRKGTCGKGRDSVCTCTTSRPENLSCRKLKQDHANCVLPLVISDVNRTEATRQVIHQSVTDYSSSIVIHPDIDMGQIQACGISARQSNHL